MRTALVLSLLLAARLLAQQGVLAAGTPAATPYWILENGPGPSVLVVGGIHGNEPAGARAADQLRHLRLARGKVVIVPRANVRALAVGKRRTPGLSKELGDLNRLFPSAGNSPPKTRLARSLWRLIETHRPNWTVDLHEGYDFTRTNPRSVGNSVIASRTPAARELARAMIAAVDARITDPRRLFQLKGPPVEGSWVRAAHERLGIPGFICETTVRDQRLPLRTRQHRTMVRSLLEKLGMLAPSTDALFPAERPERGVRVAIYDGPGSGAKSAAPFERCLARWPSAVLSRVDGRDVREGRLSRADVIVFPGGSASGQAKSLGEAGRAEVRRRVSAGLGYVGTCAGTYLAAANYPWSLKLLDADVIDRKHWARGRGAVHVALSPRGRRLFGVASKPALRLLYANGPLLAAAGRPEIPDFEVLGTYRTEINRDGRAPKGVMLGTPAIVRGRFGKGRVVGFGPHPEKTAGRDAMVRRALRWAVTGE